MPTPATTSGFTATLVNAIRRFQRDEDGALIILALVLFFLMIMMGGIAVDVMRYETTRTSLQNTLDRCTLMAAGLDQRLDPKSVVEDCVFKAGEAKNVQSIQVVENANSRSVVTKAKADTKPMFLHLIGIDKFDALSRSGAEQAITNVEIALVLDVSGSMTGSKIAALKVAATEFVDNMLTNDPNHRISITVVPYNAQVNLGATLIGKYNAVNKHNVADVNCVELPDAAYNTPGIPRTMALPMMAYADYFYGTNTANAYLPPDNPSFSRPNQSPSFCRKFPANEVRLPSQDATTLKAEINALQAGGNTSITLGMKWGLTLIDPAARPAFTQLIAENKINANLSGRPFDYTDKQAMKVVVLMTDGEHVAHTRIVDAYKTGLSPIYKSRGDGMYSIFHATQPGGNKYWVPHTGNWQSTPYNSGAGVDQQNWEDVWANLKVTYVAWQFYARALGNNGPARTAVYNATFNAMVGTYASETKMDDQLQTSCTQAKNNNVLVFGIAFSAPENGKTQISRCATSLSHYFDAQNAADIRRAFQQIASNLTQLKLTQ